MTGNNPTDRSKLGTKRHILTDKKGILLSAVISSASTHDIKLVTDVVDSTVIKRPSPSSSPKTEKRNRRLQHLCLDKAYNSEPEEQELLKRGYVLHIPYKRKKGEAVDAQKTKEVASHHKKHSPKDGLWKGQTHGTTGFESCSQDTKRRLRTTLAWCNCHAVS